MYYISNLTAYLPGYSGSQKTTNGVNPSADRHKVPSWSQRAASYIAQCAYNSANYMTNKSIELGIRAAANITTTFFDYNDFRVRKTAELKEAAGNDDLIKILTFSSDQIIDLIIATIHSSDFKTQKIKEFKQNLENTDQNRFSLEQMSNLFIEKTLSSDFDAYMKNISDIEKPLLREIIHANLLNCVTNIVKHIRRKKPADDANPITISDILAFFGDEIKTHAPDLNDKITELSRISDEKSRLGELENYLRPLTKNILKIILPNGSNDIVGTWVGRQAIYEQLQDNLLPSISSLINMLFVEDRIKCDEKMEQTRQDLETTIARKSKRAHKSPRKLQQALNAKLLTNLARHTSSTIAGKIREKIRSSLKEGSSDIARQVNLNQKSLLDKELEEHRKISMQALLLERVTKELNYIDNYIDRVKDFVFFQKYGLQYGVGENYRAILSKNIPTDTEKNALKLRILHLREGLKSIERGETDMKKFAKTELTSFVTLLHKNLIKDSVTIEKDLFPNGSLLSLVNGDLKNEQEELSLKSILEDLLKSGDNPALDILWNRLDRELEIVLLTALTNILKNQNNRLPLTKGDHPKENVVASLFIDIVAMIEDSVGADNLSAMAGMSREEKRARFTPLARKLFTELTQLNVEDDMPILKLLENLGLESQLGNILAMIENEFLPDFLADAYSEITVWKREKIELKKQLKNLFGTNHANVAASVLAKYSEDFLKNWLKTSNEAADQIYNLALSFAKESKNDIFSLLLQNEKKDIVAFLQNNFKSLVDNDNNEKVSKAFGFLSDYLECAFLKIFCQLSEKVKKADTDKLLIEILGKSGEHFAKINEIRAKHKLKDCYLLNRDELVAEFGEALHKGVGENRHKDFAEFVKKMLRKAEIDSDKVPIPGLLRESSWEALTETLLPSVFESVFDNLNDKYVKDNMMFSIINNLLAIFENPADENSAENSISEIQKKALRQALDKKMTNELASTVSNWIIYFAREDDKEKRTQLLKTLDSSQHEILVLIKEYCKSQVDASLPTPDMSHLKDIKESIDEIFTQQRVNKEVGEFVLNMVNLLPRTLSTVVLNNFQAIRKSSAAALGESIRGSVNSETLMSVLGQAIKNGIESFTDETFSGVKGEESLKIRDFSFEEDKEKKAQDNKRVKKEFSESFTSFLKVSLETSFNNFLKSTWDTINAEVDKLLNEIRLFGIVPALKALIKRALEFAIFKVIKRALAIIFYPFYALAWYLITKMHLKKQSERILKTAEMDIHENLWLNLRDVVIDNIP